MQPDPHSHAPVLNFRTLAFREISRAFGRRRALSRISFECAAGEIAAVLGPNGAGKSTLLSIAATLLEPTSGVVEYGEHTARRAGAALRAAVAHKGARLGGPGRHAQVGAELVVERHIAHRQVVAMHVVAGSDIARGEADHLPVAMYRLATLDTAQRQLVPGAYIGA